MYVFKDSLYEPIFTTFYTILTLLAILDLQNINSVEKLEPLLEKIDTAPNSSFTIREFTKRCREHIWHFHPEYELTYIRKGSGKRYIGGKLEDFEPGDLVLIGKNIPHYYINNEDEQGDTAVIVIHFSESVLEGAFFSSPEFFNVARLLEKADSGLSFNGKTKDNVCTLMQNILHLTGLEKLIGLLNIFNLLSSSTEYRSIGNPGFKPEIPKLSHRDFHRTNIIFSHIEKNYHQPISLKEMAELTHITVPAFCRYFKKITRKSFITFLNEYRIGQACKLLIESNMSVADISLKCGFTNVANFNRQFRAFVQTSPLKYKNSLTLSL